VVLTTGSQFREVVGLLPVEVVDEVGRKRAKNSARRPELIELAEDLKVSDGLLNGSIGQLLDRGDRLTSIHRVIDQSKRLVMKLVEVLRRLPGGLDQVTLALDDGEVTDDVVQPELMNIEDRSGGMSARIILARIEYSQILKRPR